MKKVIIGLSIAILALGAMGCNKQKKAKAAAAGAAEVLQQLEAQYQMNDASAADPNQALTCKYVLIQGTSVSKAEVKTSGSCNWSDLKSKAAAGAANGNVAAQLVSVVAADPSLPASAKDKWDCTAYNIKTNVRSVGAQDCKDGSGVNDATGKAITAALAGIL